MLAFLEQLAAARRACPHISMPSSVTLFWGLRTVQQLVKQEELLRFIKELGLQLLVSFSQE